MNPLQLRCPTFAAARSHRLEVNGCLRTVRKSAVLCVTAGAQQLSPQRRGAAACSLGAGGRSPVHAAALQPPASSGGILLLPTTQQCAHSLAVVAHAGTLMCALITPALGPAAAAAAAGQRTLTVCGHGHPAPKCAAMHEVVAVIRGCRPADKPTQACPGAEYAACSRPHPLELRHCGGAATAPAAAQTSGTQTACCCLPPVHALQFRLLLAGPTVAAAAAAARIVSGCCGECARKSAVSSTVSWSAVRRHCRVTANVPAVGSGAAQWPADCGQLPVYTQQLPSQAVVAGSIGCSAGIGGGCCGLKASDWKAPCTC